jgi:hypothetical protein
MTPAKILCPCCECGSAHCAPTAACEFACCNTHAPCDVCGAVACLDMYDECEWCQAASSGRAFARAAAILDNAKEAA